MPDKPEEQISLFTRLLNMVKEDFEIGVLDWGIFPGGDAGYSVFEGTEQDIALDLQKYSPYVKFKVYPVLSVEQESEIVKKLSKA